MKTIDDINYYSEEELESLGVPRDTTIRGVSETAARPLIRNRDEQIRGKALSSISKALETGKHPVTGKFLKDKQITVKTVESVIEDIEIEIRNEEMKKEIAEIKAEEERTGIHQITRDEADALLGITDEPEKEPEPIINNQGNRVYTDDAVKQIKTETPKSIKINTIMQFEIDLYLEVMKKIGCEEDIPKHQKRIKLMIENKTLLVVG